MFNGVEMEQRMYNDRFLLVKNSKVIPPTPYDPLGEFELVLRETRRLEIVVKVTAILHFIVSISFTIKVKEKILKVLRTLVVPF